TMMKKQVDTEFLHVKKPHMSKSAGILLKDLLYGKGLSQAKLADKVGVIQKTVGRWMRGECLPQSSLHQRLADALGITKDQLKDILKHPDQSSGDLQEPQGIHVNADEEMQEFTMSKLEDAINNAELGWTLNIIGEDQSTKLATLTQELRGRVSQTGDGKQISSGFSYWGISPAIFWTEACRDRLYRVMWEGIETFRERWMPFLPLLGSQKYHYVSLGVGTGDKDRNVLNALHQRYPQLYYFPMDMSPEMLRIGVQESAKGSALERRKVLPIQLDFSIKRNIAKCRSFFYDIVKEEPLLFSLLGNTLANFEEDVQLLKTLTTFLRPQDRLLLEVAYTDVLNEEVAEKAANEYAESRRFQEFVISALFQNTDLSIRSEDVLFWGTIEQERAIQIKAVYQNRTHELVQILLPDHSSVPFPPEDTIRLYLSRKYTSSGINTFLIESGLSLLGTQKTSFENDAARGIELLLLARSETEMG
ncbi:MAG: L-histidine N(alpha)-methyltransferase, partial [Ktedonobacteraceae bacterium]